MSQGQGSARAEAARIVAEVIAGGRSLNDALERSSGRDAVAPRDRALVSELAYGVLRWLPRLEALAAAIVAKPPRGRDADVRALILVGLYQLVYTRVPVHACVSETVAAARVLGKSWAKGLINATLRRYARESDALLAAADTRPGARLAHPEWLLDALRAAWPDHWERIAAANNERAPMHLRVNRRRSRRDNYLERLAESGMTAAPLQFAAEGIALGKPVPVEALPGFLEGEVSVQDGAAQLAAHLIELAPGQRVLDACAAPGGKTAHIAELEPALAGLVAVDEDASRLARVETNLARLGLGGERPHITLVAADACAPERWWDGAAFDRILVDAPCTATGVIRRHPDIKHLRRPGDAGALAAAQSRLLDALWPLLASGGALLYATCSVLPLENEDNIARFLGRNQDARPAHLDCGHGVALEHGRQILPGLLRHANGMRTPEDASGPCGQTTDGFYYALVRKD